MQVSCLECCFCLQYSNLAEYEDDEISLENLEITKDRGMFYYYINNFA